MCKFLTLPLFAKFGGYLNHFFSPAFHFILKPVIWFAMKMEWLVSIWNATLGCNGFSLVIAALAWFVDSWLKAVIKVIKASLISYFLKINLVLILFFLFYALYRFVDIKAKSAESCAYLIRRLEARPLSVLNIYCDVSLFFQSRLKIFWFFTQLK